MNRNRFFLRSFNSPIVYRLLESNFQLNVFNSLAFFYFLMERNRNSLRNYYSFRLVLVAFFLRDTHPMCRGAFVREEGKRDRRITPGSRWKTGCMKKVNNTKAKGNIKVVCSILLLNFSFVYFSLSLSLVSPCLLPRSEFLLVFITILKFEEWRRISLYGDFFFFKNKFSVSTVNYGNILKALSDSRNAISAKWI